MRNVQQERKNVILVVKREQGIDPYLNRLLDLKVIELAGRLSWSGLREVYDICDICLCPSRGGGFELNALEAISRGLPTLVPNDGCFKEYIKYTIPIKVAKQVKVYADNPIHEGNGFEVDLSDLHSKLLLTIDNIADERARFEEHAEKVRELYNWDRVGDQLHELLKRYGYA